VQEVQIEMVGAQPAKAPLAREHGAAAGRVLREHLADQKHLIATAGDRLAHELLGRAAAVHLRGIYHAEPQVEPQPQ
jgi:hypothetical protein